MYESLDECNPPLGTQRWPVAVLKLLLLIGLLTGLGYLCYEQDLIAQHRVRSCRGVVVDKFEPRDERRGPLVVVYDDSLGYRVPVRVSWRQYVNLEVGDSTRLPVRAKDLQLTPSYY